MNEENTDISKKDSDPGTDDDHNQVVYTPELGVAMAALDFFDRLRQAIRTLRVKLTGTEKP